MCHYFNPVAGLELTDQQLRRQRIEHQVLQRALQWPRAKLRIEALSGNQLLRGPVNVKNELLLFEPFFKPVQLNLDNLGKLLLIQAAEDNDVVHAIEKFGPEMCPQFRS